MTSGDQTIITAAAGLARWLDEKNVPLEGRRLSIQVPTWEAKCILERAVRMDLGLDHHDPSRSRTLMGIEFDIQVTPPVESGYLSLVCERT